MRESESVELLCYYAVRSRDKFPEAYGMHSGAETNLKVGWGDVRRKAPEICCITAAPL